MKLSLRNKILIPMAALIVVGMGVSTVVSYLNASSALEAAVIDHMKQISECTERSILSWNADLKRDLEGWSEQMVFRTATEDSFVGKKARASADAELKILSEKYGCYESINLATAGGDSVCTSVDGGGERINVADRDYFKAAMEDRTFVSKVMESKRTGAPVFVIATPVRDEGKVAGVLYSVIDLRYFSQHFIDKVKVGQTGYAFVVDQNGSLIAHPEHSMMMKTDIKGLPFGADILNTRDGIIRYEWKGVAKLVHVKSIEGTDWSLAFGANVEELLAPARSIGCANSLVGGIVVLFGVLIAFLVARSITNPINRITAGLAEASGRVAMGAEQISDSSRQLAEGASEQAASLEETSSSLEEMSSMTRQNADNASQAMDIVRETREDMGAASEVMEALADSMHDITGASQETQKIVKTIDEIAFQTNLLALNAAVEAARAGEAGAGFAVVADEVRNLAIRAAEAAKNTSALIEETTRKVSEGATLVAGADKTFGKVREGANRLSEIVREIAAASSEQAQGIELVSKTVSEMDRVVQHNAANAEESASASGDMNSQARGLKEYVLELGALVSGANGKRQSAAKPEAPRKGIPGFLKGENAMPAAVTAMGGKELSPRRVISLEDPDFNDF
jgi:methyl-accepting chemotaxis protein